MKILIVNAFDIAGGAARAAYRLHRVLVDSGVNSEMLVIGKFSDDFTVIPYEQNFGRIQNRLRNLQNRFFEPLKPYPNKTQTLFSPSFLSFSKIMETINAIDPDIVHLHWICHEMMRIEDLAAIKAPIVWSLHDMWAFTGGCHYDEECGRYKTSCGQCKVLASIDENDPSKQVLERKLKTYAKLKNLTVVGLSHWLADCAAKSTLFKNNKVVVLPNLIDVDQFKPIDKAVARTILSL
ncbi:MAG: glycosyltransferase, partial [Methylomarinum sp.]|nr:glycosyltransferase [Methylomarinum sp.]